MEPVPVKIKKNVRIKTTWEVTLSSILIGFDELSEESRDACVKELIELPHVLEVAPRKGVHHLLLWFPVYHVDMVRKAKKDAHRIVGKYNAQLFYSRRCAHGYV